MSIIIILPTYNEATNITLLMPELLNLPVHICVVDDNSPDHTGDLADEWAAWDERVHVIHRAGKQGLGSAYVAGFRYALAQGFEGALTMDADFSHHPRYIPAMIAALEQADLVIGSRYVAGGDVRYPWHRRMLSRISNATARLALGLSAHDCTAGFRLYRISTLARISLEQVFSNGYSFLVELLTLIEATGAHVSEVPIIFEDRRYGETKISTQEIFKGVYTVVRLMGRRWRIATQAANALGANP